MKSKIVSFEIVDHGIDGSQYFQGCGVAHTPFDSIATGCGDNATEALNDALEQIAMGGVDVGMVEASKDYRKAQSKRVQAATVGKYLRKCGEQENEDCDLYYYVSVRYSTDEVAS